jgi:hypothetical protein
MSVRWEYAADRVLGREHPILAPHWPYADGGDDPLPKPPRKIVTPGAKFGKPFGVYGLIPDDELEDLHSVHVRLGKSIRQIGREVWQQYGYRSPQSAANSISDAWKRMGLYALSRSEMTAKSNRERHRHLPICGFRKATGVVCERRTRKGRCWHHREENLVARLEYLHSLDGQR